jgi:hypothetical protein
MSQAAKSQDKPFERLLSDHPLFARLFELLVAKPRNIGHWLGLAEQAINTIYALAQAPDVICISIIKSLTVQAFGSPDDAVDSESSGETVQHEGEALSRLLLVLGHVSLKQLIHMEQAQAEIHRRRQNPALRLAGTAFTSLLTSLALTLAMSRCYRQHARAARKQSSWSWAWAWRVTTNAI